MVLIHMLFLPFSYSRGFTFPAIFGLAILSVFLGGFIFFASQGVVYVEPSVSSTDGLTEAVAASSSSLYPRVRHGRDAHELLGSALAQGDGADEGACVDRSLVTPCVVCGVELQMLLAMSACVGMGVFGQEYREWRRNLKRGGQWVSADGNVMLGGTGVAEGQNLPLYVRKDVTVNGQRRSKYVKMQSVPFYLPLWLTVRQFLLADRKDYARMSHKLQHL
jgi:hypothetical protein